MPIHDFDRIITRRGGDSVKWNTYAEDVLPMWVADADFTAPEPLTAALEERVRHGVFGYSSGLDTPFKEAVAHWMRSRFAWYVEPDWVAFSPSVVVSLSLCIQTFTEPGDKVVFLTPSYPPFFNVPRGLGREALTSTLVEKNGRYDIDYDDLEHKMADPRARLLILCNPHNPTGRVFTRGELAALGELCIAHNLLVLSDEIHCDYVFPGKTHIPFPGISGELAARTLVMVNPSKTFNIADLHCSAVISANPGLLARFTNAAHGMALHSSALGMIALITAYTKCAWYADQAAAYIRENIEVAVNRINSLTSGIRAYAPEATFLLWLDCRELCRERGLDQVGLERFFLERAKIALNSGTAFGTEGTGFMRMNLACPRSTVEEGLSRLEMALRER